MLVNLLLRFCLEVGLVARTEVQVVSGTQKRMDLVVYLPNRVMWFDVSVINACAESYTGKDAMAMRAASKNDKYGSHATACGAYFVPLIFEARGAMDENIANFVTFVVTQALVLCPYSPGTQRAAWKAEQKRQRLYRLAVALAHVTHLMVEEACARSAGAQPASYGGVMKRYS